MPEVNFPTHVGIMLGNDDVCTNVRLYALPNHLVDDDHGILWLTSMSVERVDGAFAGTPVFCAAMSRIPRKLDMFLLRNSIHPTSNQDKINWVREQRQKLEDQLAEEKLQQRELCTKMKVLQLEVDKWKSIEDQLVMAGLKTPAEV